MSNLNENDINASLVQELLREKRADRRWKNIRFIFWFLLTVYLLFSATSLFDFKGTTDAIGKGRYVALIRLQGMIAPGRDFSAETLTPILHDAFTDKNAEGVLIDINSPGGTPVQAAIIHDTILAYKKKYHKKVIVVGEDMLTSGAYYVAVAADKIYVNANTIAGSIGVIMKGFGFVDLMKKVGIERRVYISGNEKDRLDPFLPQTESDLVKIREVTAEVHQNFSQAVMEGRKGKLHGDPAHLFSGDFWSGQSAVRLGLADGLGDILQVGEKEFHTNHFREYGSSNSWVKMLGGQLGSTFDALLASYS